MTLARSPDSYVVADPISGTTAASIQTAAFNPVEGVPIILTLSGTWTGSVAVERSTDGGVTYQGLTELGAAYGVFTGNCQEPIGEESEGEARWRLNITRATGTVGYRLAQ